MRCFVFCYNWNTWLQLETELNVAGNMFTFELSSYYLMHILYPLLAPPFLTYTLLLLIIQDNDMIE
jgi:hypothetical protein